MMMFLLWNTACKSGAIVKICPSEFTLHHWTAWNIGLESNGAVQYEFMCLGTISDSWVKRYDCYWPFWTISLLLVFLEGSKCTSIFFQVEERMIYQYKLKRKRKRNSVVNNVLKYLLKKAILTDLALSLTPSLVCIEQHAEWPSFLPERLHNPSSNQDE